MIFSLFSIFFVHQYVLYPTVVITSARLFELTVHHMIQLDALTGHSTLGSGMTILVNHEFCTTVQKVRYDNIIAVRMEPRSILKITPPFTLVACNPSRSTRSITAVHRRLPTRQNSASRDVAWASVGVQEHVTHTLGGRTNNAFSNFNTEGYERPRYFCDHFTVPFPVTETQRCVHTHIINQFFCGLQLRCGAVD